MKKPIYLDYMATTPVDPEVVKAMTACMDQTGTFGNAASQTHRYGYEAAEKIQHAREQVAELINADPREIVWTSGATESDNLAIKGVAEFYQRKGKHIITMSTEHKAVLDTCHYLESKGFEVTYLNPQPDGLLDLTKLEKAIRADTILLSIMQVNNETGVIQDIAKIGEITRGKGIVFHVDAAQSAGKIPIDLQALNVDLMSFSAHKIYGPKGIGALFVRRQPRIRLAEQIHGGGHERGMRSGTLATHQIVGMGKAFAIAKQNLAEDTQRIRRLRDRLEQGIMALGDIYLNGHARERSCGCVNLRFAGIHGESLLLALQDLAISTSSACSSSSSEASHVMLALGLTAEQAHSCLRFCVGRFSTEAEIDYAIEYVHQQIQQLRKSGSTWDKALKNIKAKD